MLLLLLLMMMIKLMMMMMMMIDDDIGDDNLYIADMPMLQQHAYCACRKYK